jgi:membrane protein implicated in regulation of membrane protease activity
LPLPPIRARPWYIKQTWPSVLGLGAGAAAGIAAFFQEAWLPAPRRLQEGTLAVAFVSVCFLGLLKIAQSRRQDAEEDRKTSPDELRGCLLVLHRMVAGKKGVARPADGWLRVTLHRVDGQSLEQSLEYVGSEDKNKAGRRFSIHTGLIGVVARTGEMRGFDRPADMGFAEWCDYLVEHHGMTRDDAKLTRDDRFAFLGVPIKKGSGGKREEVRAVVYFDAAETSFFDKQTADLIVFGCEGLAAWIDDHYYTKRS